MQDVANQIVESQNEGQAALQPLLPLLQNMQRAQIAAPGQPGQQALAMAMSPSQYATPLSSLTGHASGQDSTSHIPVPVSSRKEIIEVNLDQHLDQQDIDNLNDMKLPLPSKVYETDSIAQTLQSVKSHNRSINQYLGTGPASKSSSKDTKKTLESQRTTLLKYRGLIENTESVKKLISIRRTDKKSGTGVNSNAGAVHEISFYSSVDDLCNRLALLCAAKEAGNNGLNNNINSILDELLRINAIAKNEYNHLYSNIFN